MKRSKILAFLMAVMLLAQPAAAMAAESGMSSTTQEQAETGSADGQAESAEAQADGKEADGMRSEAGNAKTETEDTGSLTDNAVQDGNSEAGQTDGSSSGGQSGKSGTVENGNNSQEGTAEEPEAGETAETETEKAEETAPVESGTEANETAAEGTETEKPEIEETEKIETEKIETEETKIEETETRETASAPKDEAVKAEPEESRIVLELPLLGNYASSPFDFIMDPQGLITETNAAKYNGASFEEGATLYFKNTDGDYEYSHISDWLSVVSRSTVPVLVTVELAVENTDGVELARSADFSDDGSCSLYLALLDSDGNETAVDAEGKAVFQMVLPTCLNEEEAVVCSFALTGCCNPEGNWSGMERCPRITVNWTAKPMVSEEESNGY